VQAGVPGAPLFAVEQVPLGPTLSVASQVSHAPSQASLQQRPSTQKPDWHSAQPSCLQSAGSQAAPSEREPRHAPLLEQKSPDGQSAPLSQRDGHAPDWPPHSTSFGHGGEPGLPAGSGVHWPSAVAPRAVLHTSHAPAQPEVQQTPLTHAYEFAQSWSMTQVAAASPATL
jgi:hypothetical protein